MDIQNFLPCIHNCFHPGFVSTKNGWISAGGGGLGWIKHELFQEHLRFILCISTMPSYLGFLLPEELLMAELRLSEP